MTAEEIGVERERILSEEPWVAVGLLVRLGISAVRGRRDDRCRPGLDRRPRSFGAGRTGRGPDQLERDDDDGVPVRRTARGGLSGEQPDPHHGRPRGSTLADRSDRQQLTDGREASRSPSKEAFRCY